MDLAVLLMDLAVLFALAMAGSAFFVLDFVDDRGNGAGFFEGGMPPFLIAFVTVACSVASCFDACGVRTAVERYLLHRLTAATSPAAMTRTEF